MALVWDARNLLLLCGAALLLSLACLGEDADKHCRIEEQCDLEASSVPVDESALLQFKSRADSQLHGVGLQRQAATAVVGRVEIDAVGLVDSSAVDNAGGGEASAVTGGKCLHFSISFPATGPSSGDDITEILIRFSEVDHAHLSEPNINGAKGGNLPIPLVYDGQLTPLDGNFNIGKDRYTVYYALYPKNDPKYWQAGDSTYVVSGLWPNSAYTSVEVYYGEEERVSYQGHELLATFSDGAEAPNPFVAGNPTILAYSPAQTACARNHRTAAKPPTETLEDLANSSRYNFSRYNWLSQAPHEVRDASVFRPSEDLTKTIGTDGGTQDVRCAPTYLFSPAKAAIVVAAMYGSTSGVWDKLYWFEYGFITFKVPNMYNNFEHLVYPGDKAPNNPGGFDVHQFTVSSNWLVPPSPKVPFSVSAPMLSNSKFQTNKGVAYILYAPAKKVRRLYRASDLAPPVVRLYGLNVSAYVLPAPSFLWVFRYRGPSSFWQGSPAHAPCGKTFIDALDMPATQGMLGDYVPRVTHISGVKDIWNLIRKVVSHERRAQT